jgi:hypothetical protein
VVVVFEGAKIMAGVGMMAVKLMLLERREYRKS